MFMKYFGYPPMPTTHATDTTVSRTRWSVVKQLPTPKKQHSNNLKLQNVQYAFQTIQRKKVKFYL